MKQELKKFEITNYYQIIEEIEPSYQLTTAIQKCSSEAEALNILIQAKQYDLAIKLLALGLPKREAIWWAYICCQESKIAQDNAVIQSALDVVSNWVHEPSELLRLRSKQLADQLKQFDSSSWACMSVYWSGGSIAPEGKPVVEPAPFMCGHAVANSIFLAANETPDDQVLYKKFLKSGLHIAMGGNGKINVAS